MEKETKIDVLDVQNEGSHGKIKTAKSFFKRIATRRVRTLIGAFLFSLGLGSFNAFGSMLDYLVSWQKQYTPSVKLDHIAVLLPFILIAVYALIGASLKIGSMFGYKRTLLFVSIVFPTGVFVTSFTKHWLLFGASYGISAFVLGAGFMIPLFCGWEQWPNNRGIATGVVQCALSLSPLIFNYLTHLICNPHNAEKTKEYEGDDEKYFDHDVIDKVPTMLRAMGLTLFFLTFSGVVLMRTPRKKAQSNTNNQDDESGNTPLAQGLSSSDNSSVMSPNTKEKHLSSGKSFKSLLFSKTYMRLYLMFLCGLLLPQFMVLMYKTYGLSKDHDDTFLTHVGSLGSFISAMAGLILGYISDRVPFKTLALIQYSILAASAALCPFFSSNKYFYGSVVLAALAANGGNGAIYPAELARIFGNKMGGHLFGILNSANVVSFVIISAVGATLRNLIQFDGIMFCWAGALILGIALIIKHQGADVDSKGITS